MWGTESPYRENDHRFLQQSERESGAEFVTLLIDGHC